MEGEQRVRSWEEREEQKQKEAETHKQKKIVRNCRKIKRLADPGLLVFNSVLRFISLLVEGFWFL